MARLMPSTAGARLAYSRAPQAERSRCARCPQATDAPLTARFQPGRSVPAATSVSLFASAIVAPCRTAAKRRGETRGANDCRHHDIGRAACRLLQRVQDRPPLRSPVRVQCASRKASSRAGSAVTATLGGFSCRAALARPSILALPVTATVVEGVRTQRLDHRKGRIADRTGHTQISRYAASWPCVSAFHQTKTG